MLRSKNVKVASFLCVRGTGVCKLRVLQSILERPLSCFVFRYDFDLRTGHSETGLRACTYAVDVRAGESDASSDDVWVEMPDGGTSWRLVELRPVSEGCTRSSFAEPYADLLVQNSRIHLRHLLTCLICLCHRLPINARIYRLSQWFRQRTLRKP